VDQARIDEARRQAVERFSAQVDDVADGLADHLLRMAPELGDDPQMRAAWVTSNRSNVQAWLAFTAAASRPEEVIPPEDATRVAESLVLTGAPLPALLRVYRLGHGFVFDRWLTVVRGLDAPGEVVDEVLRESLQTSFVYIDSMSAHIAELYAAARASAVRSTEIARSETARALIDGDEVDVDRAGRVLGHDLRRWHVGLVAWSAAQDGGALDEAARETCAALGFERPLLVLAGSGVLWAWGGGPRPPEPGRLAALGTRRRRDGVSIAVGTPAEGPDGFVRSHREAREARQVCVVGGRRPGTVALFGDVELLTFFAGDLAKAHRFVRGELGPLAGDDEAVRRLRTTLRAYLDEGHSFAAASRRLGIHENTIKYRVRQSEELLGRAVTGRSLKLAVALAVADALGAGEA